MAASISRVQCTVHIFLIQILEVYEELINCHVVLSAFSPEPDECRKSDQYLISERGSGLCPSSEIKKLEYDVSETGTAFVFR
jgi:hypothetical protein